MTCYHRHRPQRPGPAPCGVPAVGGRPLGCPRYTSSQSVACHAWYVASHPIPWHGAPR